MTRRERGWAVAPAIAALLWSAASIGSAVPAQAAGIGWDKKGGAFQACLDDKTKAWLGAKVELVVNDDPDMGAIDDASVAQWAAQTLKECADKAGGADPGSERQFMRHMSQWRDHIHKGANEIRRRTQPD
jgi:hypothetical protein